MVQAILSGMRWIEGKEIVMENQETEHLCKARDAKLTFNFSNFILKNEGLMAEFPIHSLTRIAHENFQFLYDLLMVFRL